MTTSIAPVHIGAAVQARAWSERRTPAIEQVSEDIWSVPVPFPGNPLRYVLVYALLGSRRAVTLIDAGPPHPAAAEAVERGLHAAGRTVADVREIVLTHIHTDHHGLVPELQRQSDAGLRVHPRDLDAISSSYGAPSSAFPVWMDPAQPERDLGEPLGDRGRGGGIDWLCDIAGIAADSPSRTVFDDPPANQALGELRPTSLLQEGDEIDTGVRRLEVLATPGHAPGHVCLLGDDGILFAGDHVLPTITPHVAPYSRSLGNPLREYLASLRRVRDLPVELALPGHGYRFTGFASRVDHLLEHHEQRLTQLRNVVAERPGALAQDLASALDWSRPWAAMGPDAWLSATGETVAHLLELAARDALHADRPSPDANGRERPWRWRAASA